MATSYKSWGLKKPPQGWRANPREVVNFGLTYGALFNEGGGGIINDCVGIFNLTFATSTTPKWNTGYFGSSNLENTSSTSTGYVTTPAYIKPNNNANFSVAVWFTLGSSQSNANAAFVASDSINGTGWAIDLNNTTTEFGIVSPDQSIISISTNLNTGQLYFGAVAVSGGTTSTPKINININNQNLLSTTGTYAFTGASDDIFNIGNDPGSGSDTGNAINANIEMVLVSAITWTQDQMLKLFYEPFCWIAPAKAILSEKAPPITSVNIEPFFPLFAY